MSSSDTSFTNVRIVEDGAEGQMQLSALSRHGDTRKTKIKNNFTGLLQAADSRLLADLCSRVNTKLPAVSGDEIVVGMYKSGIIAAGYLAMQRGVRFNWTTPDKLGDFDKAICYTEDHRDKSHYLYGVKPSDNVVLVEDEVTSGKGIAGMAAELQKHGVHVIAICSLLETLNFKGREYIKAQTGLDLVSLTKIKLS
jgi:adenine phosphoribosyltransferase